MLSHFALVLNADPSKFIIQGDFLLASNREDILVDNKWNAVLRDSISLAFCRAFEHHFRKHAGLAYTWLQYVPRATSEGFLGKLRHSIIGNLVRYDCLMCEDGEYRKPSEVLVVGSTYKDAQKNPLVPEQYITKHYLSRHYDVRSCGAIFRELGAKTMDVDDLVAGLVCLNSHGDLVKQDLKWLDAVCSIILAYLWKPHWKSNLYTLKNLPLAPLVDGRRVSVMQKSNSKLLFDKKLAGIPKDLNVQLVQPLSPSSSHYQLLAGLGVQEAEPTVIVKTILDFHQRTDFNACDESHIAALPSHAYYLFRHDPNFRLPPQFRVLTGTGTSAPSQEVYLLHNASISLKTFIAHTSVASLHKTYYKLGISSSTQDDFMRFIQSKLRVNAAPRVTSGQLSPEFLRFLEVADTDTATFLTVLKDLWPYMQEKPGQEGLKRLRAVIVTCSDGLQRRIDTTFVMRQELQQLQDLPFLPIDDPSNEHWNFLAQLGVSLSADATCYLKQLRQIAQSHEQPDLGDVENLYCQLSVHFNERGSNIQCVWFKLRYMRPQCLTYDLRDAFKAEHLIYVPPEVEYAGPYQGDRWISSADVVRGGPSSMQTKINISRLYPRLGHFFGDQLRVPECPRNILVAEWDAVLRQKGDITFVRIDSLQDDVCEAISDHERNGDLLDWLPTLAELPIFLVRNPTGELRLERITGNFFIPDKSGDLARLFADGCDILHLRKELPLHRLELLLETTPFRNH